MNLKRMVWLLISLFSLLTSCSTGSSSGGGSTTTTGGTTAVPLAYTNTDLAGSWRYSAKGQVVSIGMTGTLTFNNDVKLIKWENDRCPGRQVFTSCDFWMWPDGYVKGHNPAFCSDTTMETKFSMNFIGSTKNLISGIMDIHYFVNGSETYDRYDITMTK